MSAVVAARARPSDALLSIVVPVFNEAEILEELTEAIEAAARACRCRHEVLFVNDGSEDGSAELLDQLAAARARNLRVVHFSRNFGHQAAVQAGLVHAKGDALVIMDADFQDDPEVLPRFVEAWREGYDVVYAIRVGRKEGRIKRFLFGSFYRLLNVIAHMRMPADAGNFGLIDRRVAREAAALGDRDRYYAGLRCWVGFRQIGIPVERGARYDDTPRVGLLGLARLARAAIFSFSTLPLTVFYLIALASLAVFLFFACFTLYHKLFTGEAILGWTSTVMTASFFGAMNALGIAVLGEYVWRIYDQVRGRPLFIVDRTVNLDADALPDPVAASRESENTPRMGA